jgi:hypothetical protein
MAVAVGLGACGEQAPQADARLVLDVRIDRPAADALEAEGLATLGFGGSTSAALEGCARLPAARGPLPEDARITLDVGGAMTMQAGRGRGEARFGVLDRDLSWTPVGLEGTAAGGWMVSERSAGQVPATPELRALVRSTDGSITAHRSPEAPGVALEIDTAGGTWRCDGSGDSVTVPWWLARGALARVWAVQERVDLHRTADGLLIEGRVRVRVPAASAERPEAHVRAAHGMDARG